MTYGDFKDLNRIIFANKVLCDKAFNIAKDPKYDGYQCGLASIVYEFFNEKLLVVLKRISRRIAQPIIKNFNKRSTFTFHR